MQNLTHGSLHCNSNVAIYTGRMTCNVSICKPNLSNISYGLAYSCTAQTNKSVERTFDTFRPMRVSSINNEKIFENITVILGTHLVKTLF